MATSPPSAPATGIPSEPSFLGAVRVARGLLLLLTAKIHQLVPWSLEPDHRAVGARRQLGRLARRLHQSAGDFHPPGIRHELALLADRLAALAARRLIDQNQHDELTALLGEISRALPRSRRPEPEPAPMADATPPRGDAPLEPPSGP